MSLLGSIVTKILHPFGGSSEAQAAEGKSSDGKSSGGQSSGGMQADNGSSSTAPGAPPASSGGSPAAGGSAASGPVDVEQVLNDMAAKNGQKLNWRTSIVDLMKLLGLDSSLQARQQLADELNYSGDKNDSATMNVWLHKQVIRKLEENGGKVPADLKD